jgi:hypothetical protein
MIKPFDQETRAITSLETAGNSIQIPPGTIVLPINTHRNRSEAKIIISDSKLVAPNPINLCLDDLPSAVL